MENHAQQIADLVSDNRSLELAVVNTNCSVSDDVTRTISPDYEYCSDGNDAGTMVGANHLIVENILRYCNAETRKSSLSVNHMWRCLALKYWTLEFTYDYDEPAEVQEILQNREQLMPFKSIGLPGDALKLNWMTYSPELTDLSITNGTFSEKDLYDIVCDTFYKLKQLFIHNPYLPWETLEPPLQAVHGPVSQLQELSLLLHENPEDSDFFSDDFCFKLFARLGNLKVLDFFGGGAERKIPLFAALTKGNVKLQMLRYRSDSNQMESLNVVNEYFQRCGELLRFIDMKLSVSQCRDLFAEYSAKNLEYLKLQFKGDLSIEFEKRILDVSKYLTDILPDLPFHLQKFKSIKQRLSRCKGPIPGATVMEELVCRSNIPNSLTGVEMDYLFKIFHGTLLLRLELTENSHYEYYLRRDELIAAGKAYPNLAHLVIDAELETWVCQDLMGQVFVNFRELETFIWRHDFTADEALSLLCLPKLQTVRLRSLTMPRKLHDALNFHVANLEVPERHFQ